MADNIEIKARLAPDRREEVRDRALARSPEAPIPLRQKDTFYRVPTGRLKLREFGDGTGELIAYERPDQAGPKHSSYVLAPTNEPAALHEALARSVGVRGVVEKRREVVLVGQTRVHLDEVEGLGSFVELEVVLEGGQSHADGEAIAAELMRALGIDDAELLSGAYIDLLEAQRT